VKLLGPGEYIVESPGTEHKEHFGLAVQDYTHSTAPNRRFADLVTQRLLKAPCVNIPAPYSQTELTDIAAALHGTRRCREKSRAPDGAKWPPPFAEPSHWRSVRWHRTAHRPKALTSAS